MLFLIFLGLASPSAQNNLLSTLQQQAQEITDISSDLLTVSEQQRVPELFYTVEKLNKNVVRLEEFYKNHD